MDFSTVSTYENVSDIKKCSESVLYEAVNNVLAVTTINGSKIFCPVCVNTFKFKFELLDHLKNNHHHFLRRTTEKSFMYEQCPFCYANLFGKLTLTKHSLLTHSKLIAQLYLQIQADSGHELRKCCFCNEFYSKKKDVEFVSHVEEKHFLHFTELFYEEFMKGNETVSSPKFLPQVSPHNLTAIPEINRFDMSSLNEQLCLLQRSYSDLKSILKFKRSKMDVPQKAGVCRVLQFDLPDENKENSVLTHNIQSQKHLTLSEHNLLCSSKTEVSYKDVTISSSNAGIQPVHSSTPKETNVKSSNRKPKPIKRKLKLMKKATFKSYFLKMDFAFQCGKCKKLFQENIELHSHIKKNHKLFILNLLHPCYQCAICEAKFFKNYYLKKHILLHTGHKENVTE